MNWTLTRLVFGAVLSVIWASASSAQTPPPDKQTVADAYAYLLGRALVVRQEHTDLKEPGVTYNVIKYNALGSAEFANPNLDVAYLEAWIAVDDKTPVLLEVPKVNGRYYTAQILDEWGEVITNINERTFPFHPNGTFAFVAPGSKAVVPQGAERIELNSRKAKMLGRVEIKDDKEGAVGLQKQFKITPMGRPEIEPAVAIAEIDNKELVGVELFDSAGALLASAHDVSPAGPEMQAKVREVAKMAEDPQQRQVLDRMIRTEVIPQFRVDAVTKTGVYKNNWLATIGTGNYGADYRRRAAANLVGIWANANDEVIYFVATEDADGKPLNGSNEYIIDFSKAGRPEQAVNGYWSVILLDVPNYRVVPNRLNRFNLNNYSGLKSEADGSLKILLSKQPGVATLESNWLPTADGKAFSLTLRTYVPKDFVKRGEWFPPAIKRVK